MKKVLAAMSGGVDSSVAAHLLKTAGYSCIGCTMKLYESNTEPGRGHTCCSADDVEDARAAAYRIGIPYYVFNFKDGFREHVIDPFISAYESGKTPNPCIECNRYMKFGKLFERAEILSCDFVATGHYAKIGFADGKYVLKKAADPSKDQSYVLYMLTQKELSKLLLPLGELTKDEVRRIAEDAMLQTAHKPDSQDICFVPDGNYAEFIEQYTGNEYPEGDFILPDGRVVGRHRGIIRYTVGKRRGLGVSYSEPLYVKCISPEDNTVTLSNESGIISNSAKVENINWISGLAPFSSIECKVRIRYRQPEKDAIVHPLSENEAIVEFAAPQKAVTPGQAAVFYDGETVLGGGTIE